MRPTPAEHALLDAVWHYQRARATARASPGARLVASVIARRAASSPAAAARTLARRLALLGGARPEPSHPALPWDDSADEADDVADALLAPAGLGDPALERECTTRLLALARAASHAPSKVAAVRRLLRRTSECVLIFSEYRDVVSELVAALADLTSIAAIHGALSPGERQRAVEAFTAGTVRTLVATDAAGEGLNLHARCRLVVNLELPWMPRRLEQRIGRVDRLGQRRPVHAVQLAHRGVFEGTVIARLERRRASAAGRLSTPHDTAEGATVTAVRRQCAKWSAEHQTQDAMYQPHAPHAPAGRCTRPAAVLVFSTPIRAASGHLVQRHVTALQIDVGTTRHLTRRLVRRLIQDERVRCALRDDVHAHVVALSPPLAAAGAAIARRHTALLAALEPPRGRRLYQASLFDSRGEQQARRAAARQSAWCAHVRRQQQAATELHDLHAGAPEFVAAWIGAR